MTPQTPPARRSLFGYCPSLFFIFLLLFSTFDQIINSHDKAQSPVRAYKFPHPSAHLPGSSSGGGVTGGVTLKPF